MRPGEGDALVTHVRTHVWPSVEAAPGFLGGEILRSFARADERLLLLTRWDSEQALAAYLGPSWTAHELAPVPEEAAFLDGVPFVDNWTTA